MNLYFISGLGADKRVFQKLILPDTYHIHYIEWIPVSKNESLESYCRRLSEQIDTSQPFSLVGLSFGGVISIEMSKFLSPVQTILISSFCKKQEVPRFYVFLSDTGLYKILPTGLLLKPNHFVFRLFGAYKPAVKDLIKNILQDTDPVFFHWAVRQLFSWNNEWKPANLLRIHGTADKVLPYKSNMEAIPVEGGAHLMVYSQWETVSEILSSNLIKD
jgi:pimeloyl-ACP methyl ester carboxylesterase